MMNLFNRLADTPSADPISAVLWKWTGVFEKIGQTLFYLLFAYGLYETVAAGINAYQNADILGGDEEAATAAVLAVLSSIFVFGLLLFLEYAIYHLVVLLLGGLARLIEKTPDASPVVTKKKAVEKPIPQPAKPNVTPPEMDTAQDFDIEHFVQTTCPTCGEGLTYPVGITVTQCPHCNSPLKLKY